MLFRSPGIQTPLPVPADAPPGTMPPTFDGNPERIGVDTFSVFLDPTTARVFPPPVGSTLEVTSNVTVTNITGPVDYAFRSYIIDAEGWNMPTAVTPNVLPASTRARTSDEFTVASMNLERFFDMTDDPATSDAVLTPTAFATRLEKASRAILTILQAPDVIGVEEVENLPTLQALADTVNADAPGAGQAVAHYDAFLMEGNDIGGIDVGFLVRTDKVSVTNVEQYSKNTTYVQPDGTTAQIGRAHV